MAADPVIETPVAPANGNVPAPGTFTPQNQPAPAPVQRGADVTPATPLPMPGQPNQPGLGTMQYQKETPAAVPPTVTQPAAAQPQPAQPAQPQTPHEMHQSLYQRALSILAPPTKYVDAQGNPQQTRPSLSNSILSGAIAGMLTPTAYRQGTFGPAVVCVSTTGPNVP